MAQNNAAWIEAASARFTVKEAPKPKAGPGEVVIKNAVVSIVSVIPWDTEVSFLADCLTRIP